MVYLLHAPGWMSVDPLRSAEEGFQGWHYAWSSYGNSDHGAHVWMKKKLEIVSYVRETEVGLNKCQITDFNLHLRTYFLATIWYKYHDITGS